ncbi:cupin domain-containing protein [Paenibacillus tyrfis]|uniref:cupin domain-containing protein n=1 Tax=Paenibacillus tyrfis TaxID=1501230 RepID=UPI000B58D370|nr:cupin domain-containing protein [Paenibacillus tyrfis]
MESKHVIIPKEKMVWSPGVYENTEMCYLWDDPELERRVFLLKMKPGSVIPMHDHPQREIAMLLEGEMILNETEIMREGDFLTAGLGESHVVTTEKGCVLFLYIDYNVEKKKIVDAL